MHFWEYTIGGLDWYEIGYFSFKIFSCLAYAHVPDYLRKKLDDKAEKCIFIGYNHEIKGHKLSNPNTKR